MIFVVRSVALSMSSLTPVTVTVWAVDQFLAVKVSASETVVTDVSELVGVRVTSPVGSESRTTVYVAVPPSSSAETPFPMPVVSPAVSSSVTVTLSVIASRSA